MVRLDDSAAFASNWRVVLAMDAALGAIVSMIGVVVAVAVSIAIGIVMVVAGVAYLALVGVRARRWQRMRRQAQA
jgi:hypothetical protein